MSNRRPRQEEHSDSNPRRSQRIRESADEALVQQAVSAAACSAQQESTGQVSPLQIRDRLLD